MEQWQIAWDNGHASGVFPVIFKTKTEASKYGANWKRDMVALEADPKERAEARRAYQWEVIPWTVHPSGRAGNSQWGY
jgi:hypothetical protein